MAACTIEDAVTTGASTANLLFSPFTVSFWEPPTFPALHLEVCSNFSHAIQANGRSLCHIYIEFCAIFVIA